MENAKSGSTPLKTPWFSPREWAVAGCLVAGAMMASGANAQVHRCKDPSGQLVYSDRPCGSGQAGGLIESRKSDRAIYEERVRAYEAEARKQDRYAAEREQEMRQQSYQAQYPQAAYPQQKGYAERLAERNSGVQSNLTPRPGAPRSETGYVPPEAPPAFPRQTGRIECTGGVCKDRQGNRYEPEGNGNFRDKSTGNRCKANGICF